jgi:CubicO group peptidase (beta-lactamase class C family)
VRLCVRGEVGAACCVYRGAEPVVDLWGGTTTAAGEAPYTDRTLQLVASATKGALAIVAHRLAERGEIDLDAPVARYCPSSPPRARRTCPCGGCSATRRAAATAG